MTEILTLLEAVGLKETNYSEKLLKCESFLKAEIYLEEQSVVKVLKCCQGKPRI